MAPNEHDGLRVGEIAAATGLTVRTLHHYEAIGLVRASARTTSGHRVYGPEAVDRLYRVSMLRALGLSLDQIGTAVDGGPVALRDAMVEHLAMVDERAADQQRLRTRLAALVGRLDDPDEDLSPDLLDALEDIVKLQPVVSRRVSILVYRDLRAAYDYLVRVYGLGPGELTRDDAGEVTHAVVHAGDGEVWLHPETERFALASPQRLGAATATMAVMVDDVDAHHRRAVAEGAAVSYGPVDQPYGFREYGAVDPEGHLWSFMRPLDDAP